MTNNMTVQELNDWMLQVAADVCAYGGSQRMTLTNLNHVISGEAFGCQQDDPQNKLGKAVEAWYDDYMSHLLPVDHEKNSDTTDQGKAAMQEFGFEADPLDQPGAPAPGQIAECLGDIITALENAVANGDLGAIANSVAELVRLRTALDAYCKHREKTSRKTPREQRLLAACNSALAGFRGLYDAYKECQCLLEDIEGIGALEAAFQDERFWPLTRLRDAIEDCGNDPRRVLPPTIAIPPGDATSKER